MGHVACGRYHTPPWVGLKRKLIEGHGLVRSFLFLTRRFYSFLSEWNQVFYLISFLLRCREAFLLSLHWCILLLGFFLFVLVLFHCIEGLQLPVVLALNGSEDSSLLSVLMRLRLISRAYLLRLIMMNRIPARRGYQRYRLPLVHEYAAVLAADRQLVRFYH